MTKTSKKNKKLYKNLRDGLLGKAEAVSRKGEDFSQTVSIISN